MPSPAARRLPAPARQPRRHAKRFLLVALVSSLGLLLALSHALAAISLTTTAAAAQNFDTIGTTATAALPADFRVDKPTTVRTVGNYATAAAATERAGGANLSTTASNGIYNFGSGTTSTGGADRAVGFLSSGTATQSGNLYAQLANNTGGPLSGLQISYDVEKYRNGSNTAGFRIQLFYSFDGTTWTGAGQNFFTGFASDANNSGFATVPGATVSVSGKVLSVAVPAGASIYLAWNYSVDGSGTTTTNAQALAVDNISILAIPDTSTTPTPTATATPTPTPTPTPSPTNPTATGTASPNSVQAGSSTTLTVNVTPGANPASTGLAVSADLSSIGGLASQSFAGSGNTYTFQAGVAPATAPGAKTLPVTVTDAQGRAGQASISLTVEQPPPPPDHVVISQIYGGGGNTGATFTNDYVELYNPTTAAVSLTGWSIQYGSATGSAWTNKQPLGGSIGAGEYYLVKLGSGGATGSAPPDANIAGDINMSASAGKVALVGNGESLTGGACPVGVDADIVDFVGYGSTANCREGSANAPAPGNATALFRKGAGSVDTNQNGSDFATGTPAPRRTAPIVELGPWVASTEPISDGTNVPHDATVTVGFSEPVDADAGWYNIACTVTGLHNDATVAHTADFKSYAITPNANFQFGEQCTVTILKGAIHDQDTDDSAPDTDTLFADYAFTFTVVAAGQPAPYAPGVHLTMGNPSNAAADPSQPDNYLMEKPTYALSYNRAKGTPNWVSWHLDSSWYGVLSRVDTFRPDPAVPADWYRVQATDYFASGFDRGHMTPNADRDNENRVPINQETYLMSNMVPQAPDNNQGPWAHLEAYLRTLTDAGSEIYIVSGPAGVGGTGSNGPAQTIAGGHVTVPAYTWKVALVLPKQDGDDTARVTAATRTIAVIMPNTQGIRTSDPNDWQTYLKSVDDVEALTGYDFFSNLPAAVQNSIEAGVNGQNPPGTSDQSATTAEDTPVQIALGAVSPDANATFTYTVVGQPAHGTLSGAGANLVYTPAPDYNGADSFTFRAADGHATSNTSTVTINVTPVNDPPAPADDAAATDEDTPVSVNVLANDTDVEGDALSVASFTQGAHGSVTGSGGVLTYTPAPDYNGADSFTYTVTDGHGGDATAAVSVTVRPVNDAPVAAADTAAVDQDTSIVVGVLANDADVDGDALAVSSVTQGAHGAVSITAGGAGVSYTPAAGYVGADSFTYTASDGHGGTSTAAVSVTVRDTTPPALAVPNTINAEATSAAGALVTFSVSATDNSGAQPSIQCSALSGGTFPVGTTNVNCQATDASGNQSPVRTFQVNVLDLPPVLVLPSTMVVDSTSASGAVVAFNPTATDKVSGPRPVACAPASGSLFAVGQTTVNCSATDDAGQTTAGSFLVYVLASGQEGAAVSAGSDVTVQPDGGPALTFGQVSTPGVTTVAPISDPAEIGQTPEGFAVSDAVAFKIDTTATFDAAQGVTLAFVVPPMDANGDGIDDLTPGAFGAMTVLHNHDGVLEELAVTSRDFSTRTIYAVTHSFSSFYLARKVDRKIVTLFDRSQAYKAGSTIPVRVKLTDLAGRNLSAQATVLNARGIKRLAAAASPSLGVSDAGRANPDNNFRFVGTDGGGYIYNLSATGFAPGRYALSIYVGKDQFFYTITFDVK